MAQANQPFLKRWPIMLVLGQKVEVKILLSELLQTMCMQRFKTLPIILRFLGDRNPKMGISSEQRVFIMWQTILTILSGNAEAEPIHPMAENRSMSNHTEKAF